jgi:hypothetical protein
MAVLDPTTPLGKVRLRVGDWHDLTILPDVVVQSALDDSNQNIPQAATLCAQYILATLTSNTHKKMYGMETWSGEQFDNYVKFLEMTILNPNFMPIAPVPYVNVDPNNPHPFIEFINDWNSNYGAPTVVVSTLPMDQLTL